MDAHRLARLVPATLLLFVLALGGCQGFCRWLEGEPENRRQYKNALELYEREHYAEAAVAFQAWLANYRDSADLLRPLVLYQLGECYAHTRDYERAVRAYTKVIEMYSDSPQPDVKELVDKVVRPKLDDIMPKTRPVRAAVGPAGEEPRR